jgi:hypothetical protein
VLVAVFLAAVSMFVVKAFATSAIRLGDWSIDWGLGDAGMQKIVSPPAIRPQSEGVPPLFQAPAADPPVDLQLTPPANQNEVSDEATEPTGMLAVARWGVHFWKSLLLALVAGYQAGFLWVVSVGIYLLLRRDIDGAELDEVFVEQEEEFGMPPLEDDAATGVPEISPSGAAQPGDTGGGNQPPAGSA